MTSLIIILIVLFVALAIIGMFLFMIRKDPKHSCEVYLKEGCTQIDGYLCDMDTCPILEDYLKRTESNK